MARRDYRHERYETNDLYELIRWIRAMDELGLVWTATSDYKQGQVEYVITTGDIRPTGRHRETLVVELISKPAEDPLTGGDEDTD